MASKQVALIRRKREFSDPAFIKQWHLVNRQEMGHDTNVSGMWREGVNGAGVTVAVVDDSVERLNPDLVDNYVASCDQWNSNADSILAAADSALATARTAMRIFDRYAALTAVDWTTLRYRAIITAPTAECPICIANSTWHSNPTPNSAHYAARQISCGHLIHLSCVTLLKKYCTEDSNPLCPLCRDPYHRQTLVFLMQSTL